MLRPESRVLFADDGADDRFLMAQAWKEAACKNELAMVEDGDQVIAYLNGTGSFADRCEHPYPGLAILDLKMPRTTGLQALQWIRACPEWRTLPVLMLTASMTPADVEQSYLSGANAYLVKPSTIEELVELSRAIRRFWLTGPTQFPPNRARGR